MGNDLFNESKSEPGTATNPSLTTFGEDIEQRNINMEIQREVPKVEILEENPKHDSRIMVVEDEQTIVSETPHHDGNNGIEKDVAKTEDANAQDIETVEDEAEVSIKVNKHDIRSRRVCVVELVAPILSTQ